MAYNSDGYIMLDFADVDFRQANQYIEGLYGRMVKVVGTNKFVIVINANNKTPLPSTVSITNNQYVIESCLYSFSVNSSDMLHITRHDPEVIPTAEDIIYDGTTSGLEAGNVQAAIDDVVNIIDGIQTPTASDVSYDNTLSGLDSDNVQKAIDEVVTDLNDKADTTALANYQPLLTAGDNINITDNIISANIVGAIKTLTYTGTGTGSAILTFPIKPNFILSIRGESGTSKLQANFFKWLIDDRIGCQILQDNLSSTNYTATLTYNSDYQVEIWGGNVNRSFNLLDSLSTVYYI